MSTGSQSISRAQNAKLYRRNNLIYFYLFGNTLYKEAGRPSISVTRVENNKVCHSSTQHLKTMLVCQMLTSLQDCCCLLQIVELSMLSSFTKDIITNPKEMDLSHLSVRKTKTPFFCLSQFHMTFQRHLRILLMYFFFVKTTNNTSLSKQSARTRKLTPRRHSILPSSSSSSFFHRDRS